MNKENCALKLVDEITLYYDARSKKHQIRYNSSHVLIMCLIGVWQHILDLWCVCVCACVRAASGSARTHTYTPQGQNMLPNTDQSHSKHI